jgi:hypothetical protein
MRRSFADRETGALFFTGKSRKFSGILSVAQRKLQVLDNTPRLEICDSRKEAGSKLCSATARGSTAYASASAGTKSMRMTLRLWTTTE